MRKWGDPKRYVTTLSTFSGAMGRRQIRRDEEGIDPERGTRDIFSRLRPLSSCGSSHSYICSPICRLGKSCRTKLRCSFLQRSRVTKERKNKWHERVVPPFQDRFPSLRVGTYMRANLPPSGQHWSSPMIHIRTSITPFFFIVGIRATVGGPIPKELIHSFSH